MGNILYATAMIMVLLWIIGLLAHVTLGLLPLLLVAAVILVAWNLLAGPGETI